MALFLEKGSALDNLCVIRVALECLLLFMIFLFESVFQLLKLDIVKNVASRRAVVEMVGDL